MRTPRLRHDFGERGVWLTFEDGCWLHDVHFVPLDDETVVREVRTRPRHADAIPPGGIAYWHRSFLDEATKWDALRAMRGAFDRNDEVLRPVFELAGFTSRNFEPPIRPRQPRTPDRVLAAVAILRERHRRRADLAALVEFSPDWVKQKVARARDRGYIDAAGAATATARDIVRDDGREAATIVSDWAKQRK
jgi:hypothetical protein